MQIPILNGIFTDENADFRTSYPRNLIPVPKSQGISNGYLRPADGIVANGTGPGIGRGGINWNGTIYRVMGTDLVTEDVNGAISASLGTITGTDQVTFEYSFDYLGISADSKLWLFDGAVLTQVTDVNLGTVLNHTWIDGYFMTTDGEFLVITELVDPFTVNPTKYGSSEADPDPVIAVLRFQHEAVALNRYTTESFQNVGGTGFPFQRITGAQLQRGCVGTHAWALFEDAIAFLGGGRNEPISVWLGANGNIVNISTREIDQVLKDYTEAQLSLALMETRVDKAHHLLYLHLPDQTLVYDTAGSRAVGEPVWFTLTTSVIDLGQYRARNLVWCYDHWSVEDPASAAVGLLTDSLSSHWGAVNGWEFNTLIVYNESQGAIFHELELVALTGRAALGDDPRIATQYSLDGETWSQLRYISAGNQGERLKRLVWLQAGPMRSFRLQKFIGTSDAHAAFARLEARVEALAA